MRTTTTFPTRAEIQREAAARLKRANRFRRVFKLLSGKIETEIRKVVGDDAPIRCIIAFNERRPVRTEMFYRIAAADLPKKTRESLEKQVGEMNVQIPSKTFSIACDQDDAEFTLTYIETIEVDDFTLYPPDVETVQLCFEECSC